jgi:hypothetical protein
VGATALLVVTILFLVLSFVVLWPFSGFLHARLGVLAYPTLAFGLFLALCALCFVGLVLRQLARSWRMSRPGRALEVARLCAGETGRETKFGRVSVSVFGPDDPTTMLKGQMETCRLRFESMVAEPFESERPLRILAFGKRDSFDAFFLRAFLYNCNLDGMYVPWSEPTISLTTEFPAYRLADPERLAQVLMSYFHLDTYKKCPTPTWLQTGIANQLACGDDEGELARLNRKMIAALSRGTSLGTADLFHINPSALVGLVKGWQEHGNFRRYSQLVTQSWSVVQYLCGPAASEERRDQFRSFVKDLGPKTRHEDVFRGHFGHGYETLLEEWRESVLARGIGSHEPPPPHIRDPLQERLIPAVLDRQGKTIERVQAVRDMGRAGYTLGADALIDTLRAGDESVMNEVVWALESISGRTFGQNTGLWAEWFKSLPDEAACIAERVGQL